MMLTSIFFSTNHEIEISHGIRSRRRIDENQQQNSKRSRLPSPVSLATKQNEKIKRKR